MLEYFRGRVCELSMSNGCRLTATAKEENGELCITVGPVTRTVALVANWAGHPANLYARIIGFHPRRLRDLQGTSSLAMDLGVLWNLLLLLNTFQFPDMFGDINSNNTVVYPRLNKYCFNLTVQPTLVRSWCHCFLPKPVITWLLEIIFYHNITLFHHYYLFFSDTKHFIDIALE